MRTRLALWWLLAAWSPLAIALPSHDCAALAQMTLPQARIVSAAHVAAGAFAPPGVKPDAEVPPVFRDAPAFCRVQVVQTPTPDSSIKVEVWLPERDWNGRFRGQGNGGFAGRADYGGLAAAIGQGQASASTDTGHAGGDAAWALGHPEKVVDFGYRAIHLMTADAKAIVKAFYGKPIRHAYFASCSNGGRQALMEAQRFPRDYDGIVAGAPAWDWTHLLANALGIMQHADSAAGYIPPDRLPMIAHAVLVACDADDGLADGVVGDPRRCRFDPETLACGRQPAATCLTTAQVAALKTIYGGVRDRSGKPLYYGTMPGAEDAAGGWGAWLFGPRPGANILAFFVGGYFSDMVYGDPHWNFSSVAPGVALAAAGRANADVLNAADADLRPFFSRGGKLILFHGWNDPAISPLGTIAYRDAVIGKLGEPRARKAMRLYMVPGMLHCDGGTGAYSFGQNSTDPRGDAGDDIYAALMRWVEQGEAPEKIVARRYAGPDRHVELSRPLCPYPQTARHDGTGAPDRAASFDCVAAPPDRAGR